MLRSGSDAGRMHKTRQDEDIQCIIECLISIALGGTSSAGNSINDRSWVAGYSRLAGDQTRHATLWQKRRHHSLLDLGTLGGPNSSVTWNVKNTEGIIVGISQTADSEPLGETWSSFGFL